IAITANALKGEADHCRAIGMDDYLSKPVQLVNLKAMLEKWLPTVASDSIADGTASTTNVGRALPADEKPCRAEPDLQQLSTPVDVNVLKALVGDDEATIREFLHDFRLSAAKIAAELRAACAAGETAAAGAHAHKLKSSARSVGALALGELCAAMEKAGKGGDTAVLAVLLPQFEQELAGIERFLERY
ncbi:MAG: Hpt domain-containing protein, partial [Gallionella sp.]|nr:Hpt domain-containing protein [Gallionella sp.]